MTQLAEELDARMKKLRPFQARYLETLVREAFARAEQLVAASGENTWPPGYFERTAGAFAAEELEPPPQV